MAPDTSGWVAHKAPDGREYYFHKGTNTTSWDKPEELKTDDEKATSGAASDWKEFTTDEGKKYYYNATTKKTTWTLPDELKAAAAAAPAVAAAAAAPPVAVAAAAAPAAVSTAEAEGNAEDRRQFVEMLEGTAGLEPAMSWEDAMRLIIRNPSYGIVKTLGERKAVYAEWREAKLSVAEEGRRAAQRQKKIDFVSMLKECVELTSRTRFQKAITLFASDKRWVDLDDELEREELFEEYVPSPPHRPWSSSP